MSVRMLTIVTSVVAIATAASAGQQQPRVTGFFSDLRSHPETGDLGGAEVFISYATVNNGLESRHYAYVQIAEGSPDEPQLVPVTVNGNTVSFSLSGEYAAISPFSGVVSRDSLIGQFTNKWQLRLPRRSSYWQ